MAQQQDSQNIGQNIDIGPFRKIRLKVNGKGYWEIWWTDAGGGAYLTRRESCRTKDRAQAEAYLDTFCAAARDSQDAVAQALVPAVDELCRRWLDYVAPLGKDKTGRHVLSPVRQVLGRYTSDQLNAQLLQDYGHQRRAVNGVANGTVRRDLGGLRTVLRWAAKQKLISQDDVPSFDESVLPQEGAPRDKFLDPGQEQRFWDQAMGWPDRRVKVFVALGLDTAARREAILELTWDRVDLTLGFVDFRVPGRRITKKHRVRVPISDRLMPVLKEAWLAAAKDAGGRATGLVVGMRDIRRAFTRFTKATGTPWVTPHVLRHTWGSLKAMKGASLYDIARWMGDTIATIEKHYLHLTPDHLKRVANL